VSTKNGEIATNNNCKEGYKKSHLNTLTSAKLDRILFFLAKGVTRED
jgi:hypothetical protein